MKGFIHKLLQLQIAQSGYENLIFSPLSLEMLLGLILPGTQGKSREELLVALEITEEEVNSYLAELQTAIQALEKTQNYTHLKLANSLWHSPNQQINAHYENTIAHRFPFQSQKFSSTSRETSSAISQWVAKQTNGLIPALNLQLSQDDGVILLSALYLSGEWQAKFLEYSKSIRPFHLLDGSPTEEVVFMTNKREEEWQTKQTVYYLKKERFHAIRLMLKDQHIGFEVYLPYANEGLSDFIAQLQPGDFDQWKEEFNIIPFYFILMPKFEIDTTINVSAKSKALGIASLFESSKDLEPMLQGSELLKIAQIEQLIHIKVKEEGIEAAAASVSRHLGHGVPQEEKHPMVHFEADHPFFYRIIDTISDKTLFQGIFTKPAIPKEKFAQTNYKLNIRKYITHLENDLVTQYKAIIGLVLLETFFETSPKYKDDFDREVPSKAINKIWKVLANPFRKQLIRHTNKKTYRLLISPNSPNYSTIPVHSFELVLADMINQLRKNKMEDLDLNMIVEFVTLQKTTVPDYVHFIALLKKREVKNRYQRIHQSELQLVNPPSQPSNFDVFK
mgnify:CR=1 FL=1